LAPDRPYLLKLAAANGLQLIPDNATVGRYFGRSIAYTQTSLSPALLGVGYICGFNVGIVMLAGGIICWNIAIPIYSSHFLSGNAALAASLAGLSAADAAETLWSKQLRFLGVGAMLVGGVWTLISLRDSLLAGVRAGLAASRAARSSFSADVPETERDLPMKYVLGGCIAASIPLMLMYHSVVGSLAVAIPMTLAMIVLAFLFCSVSGYMAGIVGSSNDPVSGMIISTILAASAMLLVLTRHAAAIGGAGVQIAHRLDIGAGGFDGLACRCGIEPGSNERGHIEPQRPVGDAAKAERDVEAISLIIQRDLRRGGDEGKIRTPRADLEKARTDAPMRPDRKPDRAHALALADRGHHRSDEEIIRWHRSRAGG